MSQLLKQMLRTVSSPTGTAGCVLSSPGVTTVDPPTPAEKKITGRPLISGTIPLIGLHGNHRAPRGGECTPLFQPPHLHSTLISCAHSAWFCPRRPFALMSQEDMLFNGFSFFIYLPSLATRCLHRSYGPGFMSQLSA